MTSTCCTTNPEQTLITAASPHRLLRTNRAFFWWSRLHATLQRFTDGYAMKRQHKIDRDAFKSMLALDDELLADIGVTRDDVRWAAQLPLEVDAALALRESMRNGVPDLQGH